MGSLISIMMLHWLQATGNKPIVLMGGGTTRVGDPSGKDESRQMLTLERIEANKDSLKDTFARVLRFGDGAADAMMVDNAEWLAPLNYIDFLRDVGQHFSVNRMLSMDSVKMRLDREHELSFLEFNYMCLQAYDFVELNRRYGCRLQMGGSDQWGNIVTGLDLGRRMGTPQLYALTCPLITTASGAKMGKTASGAVWLNADMRSPYEYWQFWRNTEDADVGRFLRLFTFLPLDEIGPARNARRRRDQRGQEGAGDRGHGASCTGGMRRGSRPRPRGRPSSRAAAETLPTITCRARDRSRARRVVRLRPGRPRRLDRRGPPADQGRRPAGQRRGRDGRARRPVLADLGEQAPPNCRSAARSTCCLRVE